MNREFEVHGSVFFGRPGKDRPEALHSTREAYAFSVFESVFKGFGLPKAIRTDNGVRFASSNALFGLSRLSIWWLRLGIEIEHIKPGHPQKNGRHERRRAAHCVADPAPTADAFPIAVE
jgi:putative transposase